MRRWLSPTLANNVWKMHAVRLCYWMHFVASVLVPFFRDWGGVSYTQLFILNAWFMFWNFLLEVPTGTVADLFGRKTSIVLSAAVAVAGWVAYTSVADFRVFLCAEVLVAASAALMSGADEALVYDSLEQLGEQARAQRVFARLESTKLLGIIAGALSGGVIAKHWGLRTPMLAQTLPCGLAMLVGLTLREPARVARAPGITGYIHTLRTGTRYFLRHQTLRVLALDMIGTATVSWLIIWLYQPQLERVGIDIALFGLVHATMCGGQMLLLHNVERLEAAVGSRARYLLIAAIVPGIAFIVLSVSAHVAVVVVAIVASASFGLSRPALFLGTMNRHIPSEQRATVLSTISMLRTLAVAAVNPIAGWLVDWSMRPALAIFGVAAILLAVVTRVEETHLGE